MATRAAYAVQLTSAIDSLGTLAYIGNGSQARWAFPFIRAEQLTARCISTEDWNSLKTDAHDVT